MSTIKNQNIKAGEDMDKDNSYILGMEISVNRYIFGKK